MPNELLKPCPFCGGTAETDLMRGYCQFPSGKLGSAVSIHCTKCPVEMMLCTEDHPGEEPEFLLSELVKCWNERAKEA